MVNKGNLCIYKFRGRYLPLGIMKGALSCLETMGKLRRTRTMGNVPPGWFDSMALCISWNACRLLLLMLVAVVSITLHLRIRVSCKRMFIFLSDHLWFKSQHVGKAGSHPNPGLLLFQNNTWEGARYIPIILCLAELCGAFLFCSRE